MAGRSRLVLNKAALNQVDLGLAEGTFTVARAILRVSESRAPDASKGFYPKKWGGEPRRLGQGLVMRGAAVVWAGRKRVDQVRTDGRSETVKKPRGSSRLLAGNIYGLVGWGFPAMFLELGTVNMHARPFLTPAVQEILGDVPILLSQAMQRRLRGEASPNTAAITARIAASRAKALA